MYGGIAGSVLQAGVLQGDVHVHGRSGHAKPWQLPRVGQVFVGRRGVLAELDRAVGDGRVVGVWGPGGIGKTWAVVKWAQERKELFPDGQLFVDLRGFSPNGDAVSTAAALRGFLDALGVAADRIPAGVDAQAALYRSVVAARRVLVVLDNAASFEQVELLVPGGRSCVVVTGRRALGGFLARVGARSIRLAMLGEREARGLLELRLGQGRLAAEAEAVAEVLAFCQGYPLALAVLAGRAQDTSLARLVAELRELGVAALDDDDPAASLPAALTTSQRMLSAEQRRVFGLLAVAPGPDVSPLAAAALTGSPRVAGVLRALRERSLVDVGAGERYSMHDLVRQHAGAGVPDRIGGLRRLVDFHVHTAYAADHLLYPHRPAFPLDPPEPGVRPAPLADVAEALSWFDAEHASLLASVNLAARNGWHRSVWCLAWALDTFHFRRAHREVRLTVWLTALDSAEHLCDPVARVSAHRNVGISHALLEHRTEALEHLGRSLALAEQQGNTAEQARTHQMIGWALQAEDISGALRHATRALALHDHLDHPVRRADTLNQAGWHAIHSGDLDTARTHCLLALDLHRAHHNPDGEAMTLKSLGLIAYRGERFHQAVEHYERAIALVRTLAHAYNEADLTVHLGRAHLRLGQVDRALALLRSALTHYLTQSRDDDAARVRSLIAHAERLSRPDTG
ncbi:tetratricopeptide repeat protein [Actinokineospora sp. NBRC 105648]|uniref:tetratricopeptide repeat protein n=1 Tax=Actinokineospora sp. NBRC 105648 TaxID=3032206 RepID=UPI00332D6618